MILAVTLAAAAPTPATGSRRAFTHSVETSASAESVWALWSDPDTWPTWDTELSAATLEGPFASGTVGTLVSGGRTSAFSLREVEPGVGYVLATRLPLGELTVTRRLSVLPDGGTQFTHTVQFRGVGGWVLSGVLGGRFRAALPGVMVRLGELAEEAERSAPVSSQDP